MSLCSLRNELISVYCSCCMMHCTISFSISLNLLLKSLHSNTSTTFFEWSKQCHTYYYLCDLTSKFLLTWLSLAELLWEAHVHLLYHHDFWFLLSCGLHEVLTHSACADTLTLIRYNLGSWHKKNIWFFCKHNVQNRLFCLPLCFIIPQCFWHWQITIVIN